MGSKNSTRVKGSSHIATNSLKITLNLHRKDVDRKSGSFMLFAAFLQCKYERLKEGKTPRQSSRTENADKDDFDDHGYRDFFSVFVKRIQKSNQGICFGKTFLGSEIGHLVCNLYFLPKKLTDIAQP